jgi:hypothetical protein
MIRHISFTQDGDICVEHKVGENNHHEFITRGIVLLTKEQADEAVAHHGWQLWSHIPETATDPPLYRVKKV